MTALFVEPQYVISCFFASVNKKLMKSILVTLSFFLAIVANGQVTPQNISTTENEPEFFLDSVAINAKKLIFDPNKIGHLDVVKGYNGVTRSNGRVYITSKNPHDYHFLTLKNIQQTHAASATSPIVFMLNNEFITDTLGFTIDSSYVLSVDVIKGFEYLKNEVPSLTIVRIKTRTKENLDKANQIMIRGTEQALLEKMAGSE